MGISSKTIHKIVKSIRKELLGLAATFTHKTPATVDAYGKVTAWNEPGTAIRAFFVKKSKKTLRKPDGADILSTCQIIIPENYVVDSKDQITFPDGSTPKILDVQPVLDDLGEPYMTEVLF